MLGDSMRRRMGGSRGIPRSGRRAGSRPKGSSRTAWLWLGAIVLPLGGGYLLATRVLFPKPALVSEGTAVPQLVGRSLPEAQRDLVAAGLGALNPTELPNAEVPVGLITAQSPLAGQQARPGSAVRVSVSSGLPTVAVPDVRGFSSQRATLLLRGLGFEVTDTLEESEVPADRVSGIEPGPGTVLQLPGPVRLFVSTGPPPDTMALDTMTIRSDTISASANRWPAVAGEPIFATESVFRRIERNDG